MICEVWESDEGDGVVSISVFPTERTEEERKAILGNAPCKLVRTIEGADWNEIQRKHYELMGWGRYKPF